MPFKLESKSIAEWQSVSGFLIKMVDRATFYVTQSGLVLRALDASHTGMVDLNMPSSNFEKFETDSDTSFTISMDAFVKAIGRAKPSDKLILYSQNGKNLVLQITGLYDKEYTLTLEEEQIEMGKPVDVDVKANMQVKAHVFATCIDDIRPVTEKAVNFNVVQDKVEFLGKDKSIGNKVVVSLDSSTEGVMDIDAKEDFSTHYDLNWISNIMSVGKDVEQIWLSWGVGQPLRIGFKIGSSATLDFYLAPRIEE